MTDIIYSNSTTAAPSLAGNEIVPIMKGGYPAETTVGDIAAVAVAGSPAPGGEWTGALTGGTGTTPTATSAMSFTRTGGQTVAGGEIVTVISKVELSVTDSNAPDVRFGDLPVDPDPDGDVVAQLRVKVLGGTFAGTDDFDAVLFDSDSKIRVFSATTNMGGITLEISMHATYVAAAPA